MSQSRRRLCLWSTISDGLAVDVAHEARIGAAARLVVVNERLAQAGFEDARNDEHGSLRPGAVRRRQGPKFVEPSAQGRDVLVRRLRHRQGEQDPQRRVEHVGLRLVAAVLRHRTVERADRSVRVPEVTHAGFHVGDTLLVLVVRVGRDAEEHQVLVVEALALREPTRQHFGGERIRRRTEQAQHHVPAGSGVEGEALGARRAAPEPRGRLADVECNGALHLRLGPRFNPLRWPRTAI